MKILIADDSRVMRQIVIRTLRQAGHGGHDIVEAENGRQALEMVTTEAPDLVLSDWNMQPVTGLELLKQVRAEEKTRATPFVMVTAEAKVENVIAARQAGVNNYVIKPFTLAVLKQKLTSVVGEI